MSVQTIAYSCGQIIRRSVETETKEEYTGLVIKRALEQCIIDSLTEIYVYKQWNPLAALIVGFLPVSGSPEQGLTQLMTTKGVVPVRDEKVWDSRCMEEIMKVPKIIMLNALQSNGRIAMSTGMGYGIATALANLIATIYWNEHQLTGSCSRSFNVLLISNYDLVTAPQLTEVFKMHGVQTSIYLYTNVHAMPTELEQINMVDATLHQIMNTPFHEKLRHNIDLLWFHDFWYEPPTSRERKRGFLLYDNANLEAIIRGSKRRFWTFYNRHPLISTNPMYKKVVEFLNA